MSVTHPIIAITGSSGAGTTSVMRTFEQIFRREGVTAAFLEGDSFHRYDRAQMKQKMADERQRGNHNFSHFGAEANLFEELAGLFATYGETGRGRRRKYLHDQEEARPFGQEPGTFTPWEDLPENTDLLFYEGLHGAVVTDKVNVAQHVDLLIGVVPVTNLEWIQKLHRDKAMRGYSTEAVTDTILRRMHDYVHYICPQFAHTHVNFQRVPVVDTSNPFIARVHPDAGRVDAGDPLRQSARHRFPVPALDVAWFVHVTGEHHRLLRREDGSRDATRLHANDLAADRTPQTGARAMSRRAQ